MGRGIFEGGLKAADSIPVDREAANAVVGAAMFAVEAPAFSRNGGSTGNVVAAVVGLMEAAELHGVTGGAEREFKVRGAHVGVKGSGRFKGAGHADGWSMVGAKVGAQFGNLVGRDAAFDTDRSAEAALCRSALESGVGHEVELRKAGAVSLLRRWRRGGWLLKGMIAAEA